ncbi:glycosyltransferase [Salarchaeum sp. JOR-1]|uniref:glycosyltransferase n=1 Tax=Salarchaeum sp. JOR-1 TaxID=2599399 RepID=UPI001198BE56|nr:glycosyltransferase [Salarchaeum sp. JOR-1]QDX41030.1 glycosyltransferase [Salarchaeum sp. JOR-1]
MDVLALTDHLGNIGGAEISTREILVGLADRKDVDAVTVIGADVPGVELLDFPGVEVIPVEVSGLIDGLPDYASDIVVSRRLAKQARKHLETADILHAHHRRATFALNHLDTDVPTAATIRDFWPICPISIYTVDGRQCRGCEKDLDACIQHQDWDGLASPAIEKYLLAKRKHNRGLIEQLDCNVFISNHIRRTIDESTGVAPTTEVIYNPIDVGFDGPPDESDTPRFVTASTLTSQKGVDVAIQALGRLEEYPDAELIVFGDGPERETLRALAGEVAQGRVEFRGRVPPEEVYRVMAGATATIFPSIWEEPFGRVTVESMALGTPVVGSDVGGIAEVIDDGESGLLFPPGDADALADRLRQLCSCSSFVDALGTRAQETAGQFSRREIAADYRSLYAQLLEEPQS